MKTDTNLVILDAYNANPSSMQAALMNFARMKAEKKMVILGDMLELGEESPREHLSIIQLIREYGFTDLILVGPEFQKVSNQELISFPDVSAAVNWLKQHPVNDFTILVKGSRGIKMEKVMETL